MMIRRHRRAVREHFKRLIRLPAGVRRRHQRGKSNDEAKDVTRVTVCHGALESTIMPTYVYQVITADGSEGEVFEVVQKMSDEPLTTHPETGAPVKRLIQPPYIPGAGSDHATRQMLSNKNLDRLGLTKYERAGDGKYEKKSGGGPNVISAD